MDASIPEVQYCIVDGDHVAYQVLGSGPVDLVYMSSFAGQIDVRWDWPPLRDFFSRLASSARLILYDRRGVGASDAPARPLTWEDWTRDLTAVLDAVGSARCVPIGIFDAGASALLFAAQHPHRVHGVVLFWAWAKLGRTDDYPVGRSQEEIDQVFEAIASTWGRRGSLYGTISQVGRHPDGDEERWQLRLQRASASPSALRQHLAVTRQIDARSALPLVQCPVLLLTRDGSGTFHSAMHYLAEHLPNARERQLRGTGSLASDPDDAIAAIVEFATGAPPSTSLRRLLTVAFVDVVGSTSRASSIGDRAWRKALDELEQVAERVVAPAGGTIVKSTGDGVLVTFDGPASAVRTLQELRRTVQDRLDLQLRVGIHTGEVELRAGDVAGIAVHLAARICAAADPGELLVSRTVRDLVAGSELEFGAARTVSMKGFDDPWDVLAAVAPPSP